MLLVSIEIDNAKTMARKIFFRAALIDLFLDVLLTALINV
jgi:hypothetical protein